MYTAIIHLIRFITMSKQLIDRQQQGKIIAQMNGAIVRTSDKSYIVNSQSAIILLLYLYPQHQEQ
jgi:hypothetical protein